MIQVGECLPNKFKALSSNPSPQKREEKKKVKTQSWKRQKAGRTTGVQLGSYWRHAVTLSKHCFKTKIPVFHLNSVFSRVPGA
jgi:hypothetical protein